MSDLFEDVPPPALASGGLRVVACGGLGEIGRNMMVLQTRDDSLVIDCGVLFPSQDAPGVDLILPDFSIIEKLKAEPQYVVLTHGHEDHIGALSYLLKQRPNMTLIGSRLTLALAMARIEQHGLRPKTLQVAEGQTLQLGDFRLTFVSVAHSVPDGLALSIRVGDLHLIHTGDFKLDTRTLDGRTTDLATLATLSAAGVDLLMSDSTNADVAGILPGERDITNDLDSLFLGAPGRVIFACFASNVHRVQQAINAALKSKRQFAFIGRSMIRNMRIASELGFLNIPQNSEVDVETAVASSREDVALICTGSQGEPLSALSRMARDEHQIRLHPGDLVMLSARLIPGNEEDIFRVVNTLSKKGVEVLTRENASIHASGHAPSIELAHVLGITRPHHLLPIHGEWRHLRAHARIGYDVGLTDDQVILMGNGEVLDLVGRNAFVAGKFPYNNVYVDGTTVGVVDEATLRERKQLSTAGVVTVSLIVNTFTGDLLTSPVVTLRGVPVHPFDSQQTCEIADHAVKNWKESSQSLDVQVLERSVRKALERWIRTTYAIRPIVLVSVLKPPSD